MSPSGGQGKSDSPRRGRPQTKFSSIEEELAYVRAERDYLKKLYRSESPKNAADQELTFQLQEINIKYPIYGYRRMRYSFSEAGLG